MGGSSKKQTVGYKYYLGMHMILCHGPVDKIRDIKVDGRVAWQGDYAGGQINIHADNLFGGEKREGGISGAVDFEPGHSTQARNSYLQARLGSAIPAFRGVVGLVLRQCYLGINPYLKRWSARLQRIHVRQDGVTQWYDAKAQIGSVWKKPQSIYIALDSSGSMREIMGNGQTRFQNAKDAIYLLLDYIGELKTYSNVRVDLCLVLWGGLVSDFMHRESATYRDASLSDISALKAWLAGRDTTMGTYFPSATADAAGFFSGGLATANRTSIFITDGEPSIPDQPYAGTPEAIAAATVAGNELLSISLLSAYGFNLDLGNTEQTQKLDNTNSDGIPVLDGADANALRAAMVFALSGQLDLNPAHIIRECLTDPDWGMGYQDADIDDGSFASAADRLYSEAMGISILWDRQIPIEDFVTEIVRHINAALYVDRVSGKFVLKLIRADFDVEDLLVLGEDEIDRVDGYSRPAFGEMVNSVTVNFWDATTGKTSSVTAQDTALIQLQGSVIGTTLQYPGFTNHRIATRVAMRNLQAMSFPLLSCTIYANRVAASLNIGDAFRFEWPDYHDGYIVMRVTGMALGDGRKNAVRITCLQDVFSLPETASVSEPGDTWDDPSAVPAPAVYRLVTEAPYYELVQRLGQTQTDTQLAANPDAGLILASAGRPAGAINATLMVDAGAGYDDSGVVDFCPFAFLVTDIGPGDTIIAITGGDGLDEISVGSHAQIDDELVRIVAVTDSELTIGRGVLDTVPAAHAAGTVLLAWDAFAEGDSVEYAAGETVDVKLLPVSGGGAVTITAAPADSVLLAQRALRPYPPGKLLINTEAYPVAIGGAAALSVSWAHRDRLLQTAGELQDTTIGDIGPEVGTTYNLRVYGEFDTLIRSVLLTSSTSYSYAAEDELADSMLESTGDNLVVPLLIHGEGANGGTTFTNSAEPSPPAVTPYGGVVTSTAQYKFGTSSVKFNGTNSYLMTDGLLHLSMMFCVEFFVHPVEVKEETYFSQFELGNGRLNIITNATGKLEAFIGSTANLVLASAVGLTLSQWNHVALTRDSLNVVRLIMNGTVVASGSSAQAVLNTPIRIGAEYVTGPGLRRFSSAYMDEVRVTLNSPRYVGNITVPDEAFPNPGDSTYRLNGKLRIELESERDSLVSLQKHDYTVLREGYGFNYGLFYGGDA